MSEYSASTLERLASELETDDKALLDAPFTVSEGRQYGKSYWLVLDGNGMWHADLGDDEAGAKATAHLRNSAPEVAAALRAAAARVKELEADRATFGEVLSKTNAALNRAGCFSALYFWEHIDGIAAERDEALALAERRRKDRADVLNVKSTDGLTSSEWLLRTAKAEAERDSLRTRLAALEALVVEACDIASSWIKTYTPGPSVTGDRVAAIRAAAKEQSK